MPIDISVRSFITFYQDETPVDAVPGDVWYKPSVGRFYVRHADGWREASEITRVWPYGYVCGGFIDNSSNFSTIDRFQFPFNSGTASHVGNLSGSREGLSANNSSQHGYVCGGGYNYYSGLFSTIDRFQFPFDSGTASHVGNLSGSREGLSANNSSQHGYVCGGRVGGSSTYFSTIDRFQFPFDSGTASHVGNVSRSGGYLAANNSSRHGYVCGSWDGNFFSIIDRFQFPFDSGTASHVGNLSYSVCEQAANNSSQHGYACAGDAGGGSTRTFVNRFQFPFDSGTATNVGYIARAEESPSGNNSSTFGYVCGGRASNSSPYYSYVDRFEFPFNSGIASVVGTLSGNRSHSAAADTTDFIQMFV